MGSKICVQSSVQAHPQSGFNNWQNMLRSQLKPKLVLRKPTHVEFEYVKDHMTVFCNLFADSDLLSLIDDERTEIHYMSMGLNHIKIRIYPFFDDDPDVVQHTKVYFKASIVHLDRNGDASQLTEEFYSLNKKFYIH
jgi:hypothetical protein